MDITIRNNCYQNGNSKNVRYNGLGRLAAMLVCFRVIFHAKGGQKRGISSKLLYFYDKKQMYFTMYKGLFYRVFSLLAPIYNTQISYS